MKQLKEIKTLKGEKSGKKLIAFSVAVFLLIAVLVFYAVLNICGNIRLKQIDEYFVEIPKIYYSRIAEQDMLNRVYEEDLQTRAELNQLVGVVAADSIPLVDKNALFQDDWTDVLDRMLPGEDAIAFEKTGDEIEGYPLNGFTAEEIPLLMEDVAKVFQKAGSFRHAKNGRSSTIIKLQGKRYLAALMNYPEENTDVLLTVPLTNVIGNGLYISISILAIIGLGMVLFQIYVVRRQRRTMWPGVLVVLVVTFVFSGMLLILESRSNASRTATTGRVSLQHEMEWRKKQENKIRKTFVDIYRNRAKLVADFLMERPYYQTHDGLNALNRIAQTDYLMRFDRNGQEVAASNSYTGFSVGKNLSEAYRAVLMGYPHAIVGPAADPYTGQMQLGTAILMTDKKGNSDGFLLAVYSANELNAELERMSVENTVNNLVVREGRVAAIIDNEDGRYIAHTDKAMIGLKAVNSFEDYEAVDSYEGFTTYKDEDVCASAISSDGKMLLYLVPESEDSYVEDISLGVILAFLFILALVYCPVANVLVKRAMAEANEEPQSEDDAEGPMMAFTDGYSIFLSLFAIFAMIASAGGSWTSFDYVFSGQWTKDVNLYSLWAVLFLVAVTFFFIFLFRKGLKQMDNRLNFKAKTVARLVNSLISYVACIFLFFIILTIFGVNTTAMLASVSIISIAIGMGAQSMAADLLAGFFMMVDGTVHVGDYVSVGSVKGYVTDMGIRTTEITDDKGNVIILNNSKVNSVCNMSRNKVKQESENEPKKEAKNETKKEAEEEA